MNRSETREHSCSFCSRPRSGVRKMVAGPRVFICDRCIVICRQLLEEERLQTMRQHGLPRPRDIFARLDEWVVGQDAAKRQLSVAVYNHMKRISQRGDDVELTKGNILLIGPTGCGKTYLAKTLARILGVPFAIADATPLTQAGYVGEDVESIVAKLLHAARGDVRQAETGIIYLDEVDKIARRGGTGRDVSGEGVQQALLKILEGKKVVLNAHSGHPIEVDTTHILFIAGGAFEGLARSMALKQRGMSGFRPGGSPVSATEAPKAVRGPDLHEFGMIPEFVGRFPIVVTLTDLDEGQLADILTRPHDALLKQYQKLFAMSGVHLVASPEGLSAIARCAIARGTGARGLRAVFENLLLDAMFDLPSHAGSVCLLDEEAVATGQPRFIDARSGPVGGRR